MTTPQVNSLGFSAAGVSVSAGNTRFLGVGTGAKTPSANKANYRVKRPILAGKLVVWVSANASAAGDCTVELWLNGAAASPAVKVTYTPGTTGEQTDLANEFLAVAGDKIAIRVVNSGNGSITIETVLYEAG